MPDTVFSGRFYYHGKFEDLSVGVTDGMITEIGKDTKGDVKIELPHAILPAGTDIHVHFRDPGEAQKEDFRSGSISALFGGTTTVIDMPNNILPVTDYERFENKLDSVSSRAFCDFGLYSLFNGNNQDVLDKRSFGLKIYLGGSTNALPVGELSEHARAFLKEYGKPVIFHAEDAKCLDRHIMEETSCRDHNLSRPVECERTAVSEAVSFGAKKGIIAHLSAPMEVAAGYQVEVTPHHLLLNDSKVENSWGKVNPPLRDGRSQEELLSNYIAGKYRILSSDHAPHTEEDKRGFAHAASGIIGVETRVPLFLALVRRKIVGLDTLLSSSSTFPNALFGIRKGLIEKGYSADFMCIDFSNEIRINQDRLHSRTPVTPFHGFGAVFPSHVVIGGNIAIDGYELIEDRFGKFVNDGDLNSKAGR